MARRKEEAAVALLKGFLRDGPRTSAKVRKLGEQADMKIALLYAAKTIIGAIARREGKTWYWELPADRR